MQTTGGRSPQGRAFPFRAGTRTLALALACACACACVDPDGALSFSSFDAGLRVASAFSVETVETPPPCEGAVLVAARDRDEFVLIGGTTPGTSRLCATSWIYAVRTGRWSRIDAAVARTDHTAVVVGDTCFVIGGRDEAGATGGVVQVSLVSRSVVSIDRGHAAGLLRERSAAPLRSAWLVAGGIDTDDRESGEVLRVDLASRRATQLTTSRGLRPRSRPLLAADEFGIVVWGGASETAGPDWLDGAWWSGVGAAGRRIEATGLPAGGNAQSAAWVAGRLWIAAGGRLHHWAPERPRWTSVDLAAREGSVFVPFGSDLFLVGDGVADVVDADGRLRARIAGPNLERADMLAEATRTALLAIQGRVGRSILPGGVLIRRVVGQGP